MPKFGLRRGKTVFLVYMPKEIEQGKSPAIRIFERNWNDESTAAEIKMKSPTGVSNGNIGGLTLLFF